VFLTEFEKYTGKGIKTGLPTGAAFIGMKCKKNCRTCG
jgi:hypothetical protein